MLSILPAFWLFTLKFKGILSVVPKKFVPSTVPALPNNAVSYTHLDVYKRQDTFAPKPKAEL